MGRAIPGASRRMMWRRFRQSGIGLHRAGPSVTDVGITIGIKTRLTSCRAPRRHSRTGAPIRGSPCGAVAVCPYPCVRLTDAIVTQDLTKDYGGGKGIFDLTLAVRTGEVFGCLGPNGAGKTTTIRLLMSLIRPSRGSAMIFGLDTVASSVEIKRRVGYIPGELPQFGGLRGDEIVASFAALRRQVDRGLVAQLAERVDLDLGRRYREYSRGNKQKLGIVLAFMHRPDLLILDEPTGGLDPLNQQTFYAIVREARGRGATIFLSSHVLSEVEAVCDRVGIIRAGRLVKVAALDELNEIHQRRIEVQFAGEPPLEELRALENVDRLEVNGSTVRCIIHGDVDAFLRAIGQAHVVALTSEEPSLEESFLAYYRADGPA